MKTKLIWSAYIVGGIALTVVFMDGFSAVPYMALEPAVIQKVVPDVGGLGGYIGTDWATRIKFDDGYTTQIGGDNGQPGERIMAYRQRGMKTIFGIFQYIEKPEAAK